MSGTCYNDNSSGIHFPSPVFVLTHSLGNSSIKAESLSHIADSHPAKCYNKATVAMARDDGRADEHVIKV